MVQSLEEIMYTLSAFFMAPVLILLALLFVYALYSAGLFIAQCLQRKQQSRRLLMTLEKHSSEESGQVKANNSLSGYPLMTLFLRNRNVTKDELDVAALGLLENVRAASRIAPMLGLIATMIPMGPALKSLADGNVQGISENLIIAFSAVIFGLVIATITFWIASVKKRWLVNELVLIEKLRSAQESNLEGKFREAA